MDIRDYEFWIREAKAKIAEDILNMSEAMNMCWSKKGQSKANCIGLSTLHMKTKTFRENSCLIVGNLE
jgi:hypothetical protein